MSSSFAGEGLGMQTQVGLLKLLFAKLSNSEVIEVNENFGNVINQAIQIVGKLMHLSLKFNVIYIFNNYFRQQLTIMLEFW